MKTCMKRCVGISFPFMIQPQATDKVNQLQHELNSDNNVLGNDIGRQYASIIFYFDDIQREIASKVKEKLQHTLNNQKYVIRYSGSTIVTEITPSTTFHPALESHQQYLAKNPGGYCNHFFRFDPTQQSHK